MSEDSEQIVYAVDGELEATLEGIHVTFQPMPKFKVDIRSNDQVFHFMFEPEALEILGDRLEHIRETYRHFKAQFDARKANSGLHRLTPFSA